MQEISQGHIALARNETIFILNLAFCEQNNFYYFVTTNNKKKVEFKSVILWFCTDKNKKPVGKFYCWCEKITYHAFS